MKQFLVHETRDNVGVAVVGIDAGQAVAGAILANGQIVNVTAAQAIASGHKMALNGLKPADAVIQYGGTSER